MRDVEQTLFTTYENDGVYHMQCSGLVPGPGHVYATLIVGKEKALLVDNGFGEDRFGEYIASITDLPVMAIVTHVHPDHMGAFNQFEDIWLHEKDLPSIKNVFPDVPYDEEKRILGDTRLHLVADGDRIDLGGRKVRVIWTPGHTQGSICLYEEQTKLMLTGDTLSQRVFLFCAVPPIPLRVYQNSLERLLDYDFTEFLAAHHPEPMKRGWTEKMIRMVREFAPEKGRKYVRDGMKESVMLYTVGRGFGDEEYCGFAYDADELDVLMR